MQAGHPITSDTSRLALWFRAKVPGEVCTPNFELSTGAWKARQAISPGELLFFNVFENLIEQQASFRKFSEAL